MQVDREVPSPDVVYLHIKLSKDSVNKIEDVQQLLLIHNNDTLDNVSHKKLKYVEDGVIVSYYTTSYTELASKKEIINKINNAHVELISNNKIKISTCN